MGHPPDEADAASDWVAIVREFEPVTPENLYLAIGRIQDGLGRVPRSAVLALAKQSGVPAARVWGALTAYPGLKLEAE